MSMTKSGPIAHSAIDTAVGYLVMSAGSEDRYNVNGLCIFF